MYKICSMLTINTPEQRYLEFANSGGKAQY